MLRTVQVTLDARSPRTLGLFWAQVLGYAAEPVPGSEAAPDPDRVVETADAWLGFLSAQGVPAALHDSAFALVDPTGAGPRLFLQQVPEERAGKNRMHLDVRVAPGLRGEERMAALEEECARLVALGASRLERHEPSARDHGWIVMADPEGNEFCLD
ncbi:VOC family protein [Nocardioides sp. GY 10127]|uniref:VOC family protein n=1 Tax=Nocardioides sp. GY 10127 TaxID=2569762 RepID=UPI0010A87ACE|nr:VOC family protein [Nocardioides sp. GY 10127]TIC84520.1 VOC family protein [Nocardioides sp. GY 10127]